MTSPRAVQTRWLGSIISCISAKLSAPYPTPGPLRFSARPRHVSSRCTRTAARCPFLLLTSSDLAVSVPSFEVEASHSWKHVSLPEANSRRACDRAAFVCQL